MSKIMKSRSRTYSLRVGDKIKAIRLYYDRKYDKEQIEFIEYRRRVGESISDVLRALHGIKPSDRIMKQSLIRRLQNNVIVEFDTKERTGLGFGQPGLDDPRASGIY